MTDHVLDRLFEILTRRKSADPDQSYVAGLYRQGASRIAQKFGEEAVETVIEAMKVEAGQIDARAHLAEESADAIFHLMVLWAKLGIEPQQVWAVLEARSGQSGLSRH